MLKLSELHWLWRSLFCGVVQVAAVLQDQNLSSDTVRGLVTSSLPVNQNYSLSLIHFLGISGICTWENPSLGWWDFLIMPYKLIPYVSCTWCWCLFEGSWLHCSLPEGLHKHVAPIWVSQSNPILSLVFASGSAWAMVYLFGEGNLYHICLGNCMYIVDLLFILLS
jgi:hypothetical protein